MLGVGAAVGLGLAVNGRRGDQQPPARLTPPVAAGTSAANIALHAPNRQVLLRWVARRTGLLRTLHMRIQADGSACRQSGKTGYGLGNGGSWHVTTHRVMPDGRPDTTSTLSTQDLRPCSGPLSVVDVRQGIVMLAMNLRVTKGREYATVIRNGDPEPTRNYTSTNFLYTHGGLAGANNRNERDPDATDVHYGLDPRELVGFSEDGGRSWALPTGASADPASRGYLPTYLQQFGDGSPVTGQPYYYANDPTTTHTMVYPNVPARWTIRALGAYVHTRGRGSLTLFVDGRQRARAAIDGAGMIRASIDPVTVQPGQDVKVTNSGLPIRTIVADTAWGRLFGMHLPTKRWYLEGEDNFTWAAPVYPLPWYGAETT